MKKFLFNLLIFCFFSFLISPESYIYSTQGRPKRVRKKRHSRARGRNSRTRSGNISKGMGGIEKRLIAPAIEVAKKIGVDAKQEGIDVDYEKTFCEISINKLKEEIKQSLNRISNTNNTIDDEKFEQIDNIKRSIETLDSIFKNPKANFDFGIESLTIKNDKGLREIEILSSNIIDLFTSSVILQNEYNEKQKSGLSSEQSEKITKKMNAVHDFALFSMDYVYLKDELREMEIEREMIIKMRNEEQNKDNKEKKELLKLQYNLLKKQNVYEKVSEMLSKSLSEKISEIKAAYDEQSANLVIHELTKVYQNKKSLLLKKQENIREEAQRAAFIKINENLELLGTKLTEKAKIEFERLRNKGQSEDEAKKQIENQFGESRKEFNELVKKANLAMEKINKSLLEKSEAKKKILF